MPNTIVIPVYPGVTHLDFTGPHQCFARLPDVRIVVASPDGADIDADGLRFTGLSALADIETCDVLCVPGGYGCVAMLDDAAFIGHIARLARDARFVTSVCTGSLILGAAGLLRGRRAACHWAWRHLLDPFGATPDPARVVRDGKLITGGGVTAGIDFALTVIAALADEAMAQTVQLVLEYAPEPPYAAGRPETAPAAVVARVQEVLARTAADREAAVMRAAARGR